MWVLGLLVAQEPQIGTSPEAKCERGGSGKSLQIRQPEE